jgi:sugar-specific transcriptional regulator TrmB
MEVNLLKKIGFEDKEANIYVRLLKSQDNSASSIAKDVGYDRTTTYYILLRMLEKGYVSQITKNNVKYFKATNPKQILGLLEEKQSLFKTILPKLEKLQEKHSESIIVEVRQGNEGLNHLYRDAITVGKEVLGLGVDDEQYMEYDKTHLDQYYRDVKEKGIKERFITRKDAKTYGNPGSEYRYVDEAYFQPTPIFIYGDRVVIITWKPILTLVFMQSEELAEAFKKHFELLWKISEKKVVK